MMVYSLYELVIERELSTTGLKLFGSSGPDAVDRKDHSYFKRQSPKIIGSWRRLGHLRSRQLQLGSRTETDCWGSGTLYPAGGTEEDWNKLLKMTYD